MPKETRVSEAKARIELSLANERILKIADLDEDTKEYFLKLSKDAEPGIVCGAFVVENQTSCAVLLVHKNDQNHGSRRLAFVKDVSESPGILETIEDYSSEKRQTTNMFLAFQKKSILQSRGEGPSSVQMPKDGMLRVAYGQSALVLFWGKNNIQKVWTAD